MNNKFFDRLVAVIKPLITLTVAMVLMMFTFFTVDASFAFTTSTWVQCAIAWGVQALMFVIWVPDGKQRGQKESAFLANCAKYQSLVENVSKNTYYKEFDEFCKIASEKNRNAFYHNLFAKHGINYEEYMHNKNNESYLKILTKKQKRFAENAHRWCKIWHREPEEIKPTAITANSGVKIVYNLANEEKTQQGLTIALKFVITIVLSFVGFSLTIINKPLGWTTVALAVYWLFSLLWTVWSALRTGYMLVTVYRNDYYKRVVDFLQRFEAWRIEQATVNGNKPAKESETTINQDQPQHP